MRNVEQTIASQYANSPTLLRLIHNMNENIRPDADIDGFFNFIWNVDTAQGFGLDIWGRIVGLKNGRIILTNPVTQLLDPDFRALIFLKALSNISATNSPSINQLLKNWQGVGTRSYVNDLGKMMMRYTFEFPLSPVDLVILQSSGIFLRPAGVGGFIFNANLKMFGFREGGTRAYTGFNQAPFLPTGATSATQ